MTVEKEELLDRATEVAQHSTTGNVKIGTAVRTDSGEVYTGSIIETRDRHQSIHSERLAVFKAVSEGADHITDVAVYVNKPTPRICGSCLHVIYEFSGGCDPAILTKSSLGEIKEQALSDLYPEPWLPEGLMFPE